MVEKKAKSDINIMKWALQKYELKKWLKANPFPLVVFVIFSGCLTTLDFCISIYDISINELPVIGYPCLREELLDRQGANIASR